jgi:hypothetical membrane protein
MKHARLFASITGFLVTGFYLVFTILAFLRYPTNYSPAANWLSDLGSRVLNPTGAVFYNTGILLTGLLVFLFFVGLSGVRIAGNRTQQTMLYLTQGFGVLGAVSIVMSGLYPIDLGRAHGFWSIALYVMLGTAFAFSVAALRYHQSWPRWLLALGVVVAMVDILSGVYGSSCLFEWVTVALLLLYVSSVALAVSALR